MNAELHDLTNGEYHASPGLSASGAKLLLPPSCPAIYKYQREHPVHKDIYDFGSAAHKMVLGSDDVIVEVEADDWRSKAAREARDEAREAGNIPMLAKHYTVVQAMAAAVREHPIASWLLDQPGTPEQSAAWTDERTGTPLRAQFDYLPDKADTHAYLVDYKTTVGADLDHFSKDVRNLRYHLQAAWYLEAATQLGYIDTRWLWIAQEKTPPYLVAVYDIDPWDLAIGTHLMRQSIDVYAECVKTDTWPGYPPEVQTVEFPRFYTDQFQDVI